jgi:hypothetical protein
VKLHRSTLVIPLAAVLLVGAAGAVMATSVGPGAPAPAAQQPAAASPSAAPSPGAKTTTPTFEDTALADALDSLVSKGTITAAQKQAVLDAVAAERATRKAARVAAREQAKADRQQLRDFLSDGVITKEEFAKLPADSPLRKATTLMDDGQITTDELKGLGLGFGRMGGKGGGMGGWFGSKHRMGGWPDASPAPTAGTSG